MSHLPTCPHAASEIDTPAAACICSRGAVIVSEGSRGADLYLGRDFADAVLAKNGKRALKSHGRVRVGHDGPMQRWFATVPIADAERAIRAAGTARVTHFESQAIALECGRCAHDRLSFGTNPNPNAPKAHAPGCPKGER